MSKRMGEFFEACGTLGLCGMAGRTTVIISHRISAVKDADHILVLEQGRVVEEGRHAELITRGGHYARLHEEQLLEEARPELG